MPVTEPPVYAVKRTPSSTEWVSPESICSGVAEKSKSVAPGVAAVEGADAAPVPTAFNAETLKVYCVPFFRPVTVAVGVVTPLTSMGTCASEPRYGVILYPVIGALPRSPGADQLTASWELAGETVTCSGAPGTMALPSKG